MGGSFSTCIPKRKRHRKNDLHHNENQEKPERPFTSQYLLNQNLSSSEINLLNQLREGKENFQRPSGIEFRKFIKNRPVVRIASWNVNNLTTEKIKNPGVLTVICLTILENNLSIIALQEVISKTSVEIICSELNNPTLTKIKLHPNSRSWDYVVSDEALGKSYQGYEYGTLIFDKSKKIVINKTSQLNNLSKSFVRNPFLIDIKIKESVFMFVIFHIKAITRKNPNDSRTSEELCNISILVDAIKESLKLDHKVILLGDFNLDPNNEIFDGLKQQNYMYCIDSNLSTNTSTKYEKSFDNIWVNKPCERFYTGSSGIISQGLYHSLIPKNGMMGWGGCASDHRPVWADFITRL